MRCHKIFLIFLLLLFLGAKTFADVFVVTSNADSGPGTLRDALTQAAANGTAVKDYINFNILDQSLAGRTIAIRSVLPNVSSNLVIDGSTQPGSNFGVSGAKIRILISFLGSTNENGSQALNIFKQHDIDVYSLMFDKAPTLFSNNGFNTGIVIENSQNVTIGAVGKGNVIKNFESNIGGNDFFTPTQTTVNKNVKISANFIGINEDGVSICALGKASIQLGSIADFTFGGNTFAEGNVCYGNSVIVKAGDNMPLDLGTILVSHNFFGLNYTAKAALTGGTTDNNGFSIADYYGSFKGIKIIDNISLGGFSASSTPAFIYVQGNKIGTDISGTTIIPHVSVGVVIAYCTGGGLIGGTNPGEANIFAGCGNGSLFNSQSGVVDNFQSRGVEVVNNIFECNNGLKANRLGVVNGAVPPVETVSITNRSSNLINGTATPNSRVDLYYSILCNYCEPQQLFTSVMADGAGNWSYSGNLSNYSIVAASTLNGETSEFTSLAFTNQPTDVKIQLACGGGNNGSITGLSANATSFQWYDQNGNQIANTLNLINVPVGKYYLVISNGFCQNMSPVYEIKDGSSQINNSALKVTPASCNGSNGSISGLTAVSYSSAVWTDGSGKIVSNTLSLFGVKPGSYTLTITTTGGCKQTYGPVAITNTTGPNIDQSSAAVQSTPCGQSTGSIKGITATGSGTLTYSWKNVTGTQVGTTADLTNQPAGTYTLQVTDGTSCGPVYSSAITIPETNGITMDESNVKTTIASCALTNGTVSGIQVTGATQYQWVDAANKVVGTSIDLTGVAQGDYTLTASNSFGCAMVSKSYHVAGQVLTTYPQYANSVINACYGQSNGSITVTADALVKSARWVSQGVTKGTGLSISNLAPGTYQLYLSDANGCEQLYNSYTVAGAAQLQIVQGSAQITNDGCSLKTGSITGVQVSGGFAPYSYSWTNAAGKIIGSSADLNQIGAGAYTLMVSDSRSCTIVTASYNVQNQDNVIASPLVNNVQICAPGNAIISVNTPSALLTYKLYDSETGIMPIAAQAGGRFTINVKTNSLFYLSQVSGSCESARVPVTVTVGISAAEIPNVITPNADGVNDYWKIPGIENYPQSLVRIYTRNGQQVFESRGYAKPFDGSYNGKLLPYGTYYYMIELSNSCNLLSGNITIVH